MSRATILTAILALLIGPTVHAKECEMAMEPHGCEAIRSELEAARGTFFFVFPLYEMWRTRQRMLSLPGAQINRLLHRTKLSKPADRSITMPNVDTLYSTAWLDLADGPVRFTIPDMKSRYHSVELMHAFSDAFAILRNESQDSRHFLLVGPEWGGIPRHDETVVRSPTRDAWLVARTLVEGADDLEEAQRLQGEYKIEGSAYALGEGEAVIPARPNGSEFLEVINTALARGPLPAQHADRIDCLSKALVQSKDAPIGANFAPQIDPAISAVFDRNLGLFFDETDSAFENSGQLRAGWRYPQSNIANFGADDLYRSAVAMGGLAALPVSEAMNPFTTKDADGAPLNGSSRYRITIPARVPVDAFWSLTIYESDGAGRWFLYDNPINRHAVNSVASEIHPEADGSIVIDISNTQPTHQANWLPAPKDRFLLIFRAYRPDARFLDGSFAMPAVKKMGG